MCTSATTGSRHPRRSINQALAHASRARPLGKGRKLTARQPWKSSVKSILLIMFAQLILQRFNGNNTNYRSSTAHAQYLHYIKHYNGFNFRYNVRVYDVQCTTYNVQCMCERECGYVHAQAHTYSVHVRHTRTIYAYSIAKVAPTLYDVQCTSYFQIWFICVRIYTFMC